MNGRGERTLEFQVRLGLEDASKQAAQLRKILNESVAPNTTGFNSIASVINKIDKQVESMSLKLKDAFRTSKGTQNFLNDYGQLMKLIESAESRFGKLGLKDLKFSDEEAKKIEDTTKQLDALAARIENIKSGTGRIGNLFDLEQFDKLKAKLKDLKIDASKFTFEGLKEKLDNSIKAKERDIENLQTQFKNVEKVINTISSGNLKNLRGVFRDAVAPVNTLQGKFINPKEIPESLAAVKELYTEIQKVTSIELKPADIKPEESISGYLERENQAITNACAKMETETGKYIDSFLALTKKAASGSNATAKEILESEDFKTLINQLGQSDKLNEVLKSYEGKGGSHERAIIREMREVVRNIDQTATEEAARITKIREEFQNKLASIFDGKGEALIADSGAFKDQIKKVFTDVQLNTKDITGLDKILDKIVDGDKVSNVLDSITASVRKFATEMGKTDARSKTLRDLEAELESLKGTTKEVETAQTQEKGSLKNLEGEYTNLSKIIADLVDEHLKLLGIQLKDGIFDPKKINEGKASLESYLASLNTLEKRQKALGNVQNAVTRWMGFYQVLNLTKRAIQDMKKHVQELDTVMTQIAVVTNMSQKDLWGQIGQYSEIARKYGVAIKGVYEVSQIFYQQGLDKSTTMDLTTETLKMARIAGIDYGAAADYMTTAVRGFKLEMSEAAHVTDVFSNLAAHTASNTEELATAISKTASSAEAVGSSFEATSAMIATMVSVTRESATNIGTALKSVISRYGEMTSDPAKLVDSEGEEMSLNRVDAALQTIGISIHDVNGQFRDFDDVILELGEKWDSLDTVSQRYIATLMAGNRQQSRFLALVGNIDEYKRALDLANNSEETSEIQTLKTLDSIDAKIERMKVTVQEFYTSSGIEELYKGILDTITNVMNSANQLPKLFNTFPAAALAVGLQLVNTIKTVLTLIISSISNNLNKIKSSHEQAFSSIAASAGEAGQTAGKNFVERYRAELKALKDGGLDGITARLNTGFGSLVARYASAGLSTIGAAFNIASLNKYGASKGTEDDDAARNLMLASLGSNAASGAISGALMGSAISPGVGTAIGGILGGLSSAIPSLIEVIQMSDRSLARQIELSEKAAAEADQKRIEKTGVAKELQSAYDKLIELKRASYESAEAMDEYHTYMNQLGDSYPDLVARMDTTGNKIIEVTDLENKLAEARSAGAQATVEALEKEKDNINKHVESYKGLSDSVSSALSGIEEAKQGVSIDDIQMQVSALSGPIQAEIQAALENEDIGINGVRDKYSEYFMGTASFLQGISNVRMKFAEALDKFDTENKDIDVTSLLKSFNSNIEDITDVLELDFFDFIELLNQIAQYTGNNLPALETASKNIDESIKRSKMEQRVEDYYTKNKIDAKYSKFIPLQAFMLDEWAPFKTTGHHGQQRDPYDLEPRQKYIAEWIQNHTKDADYIMNELDYNSIKSEKELKNILQAHHLDDTAVGGPGNIYNGFIEEYNKQAKEVRETFFESIKENLDSEKVSLSIRRQFKSLSFGDNKLINSLITSLTGALPEFAKLQEEGYQLQADNYLSGLFKVFSGISTLTSDQQKAITPAITNIEWNSRDSIQSAIDTISGIEGMGEVVELLTSVMNSIPQSLSAQVNRMMSEAQELAEKAEKTLSNNNKGMEYSAALKEAQGIFEKLSDKEKSDLGVKTADDLIQFSTDLQQWTLTQNAITQNWRQIQTEYSEKIDKITREMGLYTALSENIADITKPEQIESALAGKEVAGEPITETDITLLENQVEEWYKEWNELAADSRDDWDIYLSKQIAMWSTDSNAELAYLTGMLKKLPVTYLAKLGYADAASGKLSRESLTSQVTVLLEALGLTEETLAEKTNAIIDAAIHGNVEELNNLLQEVTGSDVKLLGGEATSQIVSERISGLKDAIADIQTATTGEYSDSTIRVLESLSMTGKDGLENTAGTLKSLYDELASFIGQAGYTIQDYNNDIVEIETKFKRYNQGQASIDLLSKGFSIEQFDSYLLGLGIEKKIDDYYDFATNSFKDTIEGIDYNKLLKWDETSRSLVLSTEHTFAAVKNGLMTAFGLTEQEALKLYNEALDQRVDNIISTLEATDMGVQSASDIGALGGAKVGDYVNISKISAPIRAALSSSGLISWTDEYLKITSIEHLNAALASLESALKNEDLTPEEKIATQDIIDSLRSQTTQFGALQEIISDKVSQAAARTYAETIGKGTQVTEVMQELGFEWNAAINSWVLVEGGLEQLRARINSMSGDTEAKNELWKLERQLTTKNAGTINSQVLAIAQNWESISFETLESLANGFGISAEELVKALGAELDDNGSSYHINAAKIGELRAIKELTTETKNAVENIIAGICDSYLTSIKSASEFVATGTTEVAAMENFAQEYSKVVGETVGIASLFRYDANLNTFRLTGDKLRIFMLKRAEELEKLGMSGEAINDYIESETTELLRANLSTEELLNASNNRDRRKAADELAVAIRDVYLARGKTISDIALQKYVNAIESGGLHAVQVLRHIKGSDQVSTEELEAVYRSYSNRVEAAIEQVGGSVGDTVTGPMLKILREAGYKFDMLDSGTGVIRVMGDVVQAYNNLYAAMVNDGRSTQAQLNQVYAKYVAASNQQHADVLETLGSAVGMEYEAFSELLTKYGRDFAEAVQNKAESGIDLTKNGVNIRDFRSFVDFMGWDPLDFNNTDIIEAYKSYASSWEEVFNQPRAALEAMGEELNALLEASEGQYVNLGNLDAILNDTLSDCLQVFGIQAQNGVIQITKDLNAEQLVASIANAAAEEGKILPETLIQLQDAINEALNNTISTINSAASGAINESDAKKLTQWARNRGIENLEYVRTSEGLHLTTDSLFDLYASVRKINALSAKKLIPDLKNISKNYGDLSSAMNEYRNSLKDEEKARTIAEIIQSYLSEPESFDAMHGRMTTQDEIAKQFWESSRAGYKALQTGTEQGYMEMEEFTSVVGMLADMHPEKLLANGQTLGQVYANRQGHYTLDAAGNAVYDFISAGFTQADLDSLLDWYVDARMELQQLSNESQDAFNKMSVGAEQFREEVKQYTESDYDQAYLQSIIKDSAELQEMVKNISLDSHSLMDVIFGKNGAEYDKDRVNELFKNLLNTEWDIDNWGEQLSALIPDAMITLENGKVAIQLPTDPVYKIGDKEVNADLYKAWMDAAAKANMSDINAAEGIINFTLNNVPIQLTVDTDKGTKTYTCIIDGKHISAGSMEDATIAAAIEMGQKLESVSENTTEVDIPFSYTVKRPGLLEYIVTYDASGVSVEITDVYSKAGENRASKIEQELKDKLAEKQEALKELLADEANATITVDAHGTYTITGEVNGEAKSVQITSAETVSLTDGLKEKLVAKVKEEVEPEVNIKGNDDHLMTAIDNATKKLKELCKTWTVPIEATIKSIFGSSNQTRTFQLGEDTASGAKGNAFAKGTLMGELGPELWVSNGHYYVAGQNGAEFVNLPSDAIVFNHLQTKKLLSTGVASRGKPVTNERTAVAKAQGDNWATTAVNWVVNGITSVGNALKKFIAPVIKASNEQTKAADSQTKAANSQTKAAEAQTKAAKAQEEVASTQKKDRAKLIASGDRLHLGYHRKATGAAGAGTEGAGDNQKARRQKYADSRSSLNGKTGSQTSDLIRKGGALGANSGGGESTKALEEKANAVKSALESAISEGFENLDLMASTYEKLDADIKAAMQKYINENDNSETRYTDFVDQFISGANMSVSAANELYFNAWQREIENLGDAAEVIESAQNLTFYGNGQTGGSAEDWMTIFGDYTEVSDLVKDGLIHWDTTLRTYILDDIDALKEYNTNLQAIEELEAMRADDILENYKDIQSKYTSALEGTLSNLDKIAFEKQLKMQGVDVEQLTFSRTAEGLKLSAKSALEVYAALRKLDGMQANVTFSALRENLEATNDHYKSAVALNERIAQLQDRINKANSKTDQAKLKQYQNELDVAKKIAALRTTDQDESLDVMSSSAPGMIQNPLSVGSNFSTYVKTLTEGSDISWDNFERLLEATKQFGGGKLGNVDVSGKKYGVSDALSQISSKALVMRNGEFVIDKKQLGLDDDAILATIHEQFENWKKLIDDQLGDIAAAKPNVRIAENVRELQETLNWNLENMVDKSGTMFTEEFKQFSEKLVNKSGSNKDLRKALESIQVGDTDLLQVLTGAKDGKKVGNFNMKDLVAAFADIAQFADASMKDLATQERMYKLLKNLKVDAFINDADLGKVTAYVDEIERWYNYMQRLAKISQDLSYQEKVRSYVQSTQSKSGEALYNSYKKTLELERERAITAKTRLMDEKSYLNNNLLPEVNKSAFGKMFEFDETGAMVWKEGVEKLMRNIYDTNMSGNPHTPKATDQLAQLKEFFGDSWKYIEEHLVDGDNNPLRPGSKTDEEYAGEVVAAVKELYENQRTTVQKTLDDIDEAQSTEIAAETNIQETMNELRDNQLKLEDSLLNAIEESRQTEIDEMQGLRDAYEESVNSYIEGLDKALDNERKMYEREQESEDLLRLQNQLAILQRTGAGASAISQLQKQIDSKQQDIYFDKQQEQIDTIKEASDKQLEKMDRQIELAQEQLDYEKQHGLLWEEVYSHMANDTPEEIAQFIQENTSSYWGMSPLELTNMHAENVSSADLWANWRDDTNANGPASRGQMDAILRILSGESAEATSADIDDEARQNLNLPTKSAAETDQFTENLLSGGNPNDIADVDTREDKTYYLIHSNGKVDTVIAKTYTAAKKKVMDQIKAGAKLREHPPTEEEKAEATEETKTTTSKKDKEKTTETTPAPTTPTTTTPTQPVEDKTPTQTPTTTTKESSKKKQTYYAINEKGDIREFEASSWTSAKKKLAEGENLQDTREKAEAVAKQFAEKAAAAEKKIHYKATINYNDSFGKQGAAVGRGDTKQAAINNAQKQVPVGALDQSEPKVITYSRGGMVENTGLAMVHADESVLTAAQTSVLRDKILSNKPNSLLNLLSEFQATMAKTAGANTYNSIDRSKATEIGSIELNMNVKEIANDYDARRAGQEAMEEMLRIARKSTMASVRR